MGDRSPAATASLVKPEVGSRLGAYRSRKPSPQQGPTPLRSKRERPGDEPGGGTCLKKPSTVCRHCAACRTPFFSRSSCPSLAETVRPLPCISSDARGLVQDRHQAPKHSPPLI